MNSASILLVEDNPDDVELTLRAFRKNNFSNPIFVARDGQEALDMMMGQGAYSGENAPALPHLILLDLKLPRLDGHEVLRALRAEPRTRLIPVIVLTSSKEEQDIAASYGLGANGYVRKPINFEDFVRAVGQLGLFWLLLNEPPPLQG